MLDDSHARKAHDTSVCPDLRQTISIGRDTISVPASNLCQLQLEDLQRASRMLVRMLLDTRKSELVIEDLLQLRTLNLDRAQHLNAIFTKLSGELVETARSITMAKPVCKLHVRYKGVFDLRCCMFGKAPHADDEHLRLCSRTPALDPTDVNYAA